MSDDVRRAIQTKPLNLVHYVLEKTCESVDQVADLYSPLRDSDEAHYAVLGKSFHKYNYDYARSMLTVYRSFTVNPEDATYGITMQTVDVMRLVKDGY